MEIFCYTFYFYIEPDLAINLNLHPIQVSVPTFAY